MPGRRISADFGIRARRTQWTTLLRRVFFQQAVDLDPNFAGGYKGLSKPQAQTADFRGRDLLEALKSAEALARRAVPLDGADAEARSRLANALYRQGDYEGGLAGLRSA